MSESSDFKTLVDYIKYVVTITVTCLGIITGAFVFFLWKDRQEMKDSVQEVKAEALKGINDAQSLADLEIQRIKDEVKYQTNREIAEVFRTESIREMIEERARVEINEKAKSLLTQITEKELSAVRSELKEASEINYYALKMKAMDTEGFLRLKYYSDNAKNPDIREFANNLLNENCDFIRRAYGANVNDEDEILPNQELIKKMKDSNMFVRSYAKYFPIEKNKTLHQILGMINTVNAGYGKRFTLCSFDDFMNFIEDEFEYDFDN